MVTNVFRLGRRGATALLLVAVLLVAVQAPAVALSDGRADHEITHQEIFDTLAAGESFSPAQVGYIMSTDLAGLLPDPSHVEEGVSVRLALPFTLALSRGEFPDAPASVTSTTCEWVEMWWRQYSYLGSVIYRMHHKWTTCWNGSIVTSVSDRHTWFDEMQGIVVLNGLQSDWYDGIYDNPAESFTQEDLEYCIIHYGCYYHGYPWIRAYRYGSGSHTWSHGL